MKEEEKTKKFNKKWLIAVVLIVVIAIALVIYSGILPTPTGLAAVTETNTNNPSVPPEQPKFTVTGNELLAKEVKEVLPYYEPVDLESGRYTIEVFIDKPIWIMLYDENNFNIWKNGGDAALRVGTGCCMQNRKTDSFSDKFDINEGEEGKYYLVIEDKEYIIGNKEKTTIKFKITQILKF